MIGGRIAPLRAAICIAAFALALAAGAGLARADYPGCDRVGNWWPINHCMANCCATHDEWYAALGCTEVSWIDTVGQLGGAIPLLRAAGESISEAVSEVEFLAACLRHPDACGPALIQMLTSPVCGVVNFNAMECFGNCLGAPDVDTNTCVDAGRTWQSTDPNCCDDRETGGTGPNPDYCPMPSCPGSCGALAQRAYPDCGCYCPNDCGPQQTRDQNDCGCFCNVTCAPPYTQAADCSCIAPSDPCLGVVCDRGPADHCENGQCVCTPNKTCNDVCAGGFGIRFSDNDGCGSSLSCNCGCQPGCDSFCSPIDGSCPDLGCGKGLPGPDPCCPGQSQDCAGICGGVATVDCAGECMGGRTVDDCGVCGGDGSSCRCQWFDCDGTCNGPAQRDCFGTCNGGATYDVCGVCGGDGSECACTPDCFGVCNGGATYDVCGVCGGDGSECACTNFDCFGVCNGGATFDQCGVCGGDGSECGGGGCGTSCGGGCGGGGCGGGCGEPEP